MKTTAPATAKPAEPRHLLFTYGTMMQGNRNHARIDGSVPVGKAATAKPRYRLFCLGYAPGMVRARKKEDGHAVQGEVYKITDALLQKVDSAEGHPWKYRRERIEVTTASGETITAFGYLIARDYTKDAKPVPEGLWKQPEDAHDKYRALRTKAWESFADYRPRRTRRLKRLGRGMAPAPAWARNWERIGDILVYRDSGFLWDVETGECLGRESDADTIKSLRHAFLDGAFERSAEEDYLFDVRDRDTPDPSDYCPQCCGELIETKVGPRCQDCGTDPRDYLRDMDRHLLSTPMPDGEAVQSELRREAARRMDRAKRNAGYHPEFRALCKQVGHDPDQDDPTTCYVCGDRILGEAGSDPVVEA